MDDAIRTRWIRVLRNLRPNQPPPEGLYVEPRHGCAAAIVDDFLVDPVACRKFLLIGATGGGKSSELREIARRLRDQATLVTIDLDASGVNATTVSAFDLLYISALQLLRTLPQEDAEPLFQKLRTRYAGEEGPQLGDLKTAWGGLSQFAEAAGGVATAMGGAAAAAGVDLGAVATGAAAALSLGGNLMGQVGAGVRLRSKSSGVVAETSPMGRSLQEVCVEIARVCRRPNSLPLCLLIDGLEKMNGEAGERFRQVFEQTRLLADTQWTAVIASPPCTLTETNSAAGRGYLTRPVWGFGPDDFERLKKLLELRLVGAEVDLDRDVETGQLSRIAEQSGGLPRLAVQIAYESVKTALLSKSPTLTAAHTAAGIQTIAQQLGLGLNAEHLRILSAVRARGLLPEAEKAATLFADGRILAYPPMPPSQLPRFVVHPLLEGDVALFDQSNLRERSTVA